MIYEEAGTTDKSFAPRVGGIGDLQQLSRDGIASLHAPSGMGFNLLNHLILVLMGDEPLVGDETF